MPQGSVLGSLLFLIMINDIYLNLKSAECLLFADDTTIYCTDDNIELVQKNLQSETTQLIDWLNANKLSLNMGQTCLLSFGSTDNVNIRIRGINVPKPLQSLQIPRNSTGHRFNMEQTRKFLD